MTLTRLLWLLPLALLAAAWHGHPSRDMIVIGVTGTDGKTTTVNLIRSILSAAGIRTGMVSTVNALIATVVLLFLLLLLSRGYRAAVARLEGKGPAVHIYWAP